MARSKLDTLIYSTILLAPMVTALAVIALTPTSVVTSPCPTPTAVEPVAPLEPIAELEPAAVEPELVEPEPAREPAPGEAVLPGAGMLMYDGQLVLTTRPDTRWAVGPLKNHSREWSVAVSRRVDAELLPPELQALVGVDVTVYDADGRTCTTNTAADALRIYGRQEGDLTYFEYGTDDTTPAQRLAVRKQVFAEAQLLLARLGSGGPGSSRCDGLWARASGLPAPAVFRQQELAGDDADALATRVIEALAPLPSVRGLRAAYAAHRDDSPERQSWAEFRDSTLQVSRWDEVGGARSFVNVVVGDGGEACSDAFSDQVAVLFALEGDALVAQDDPGFLRPLALMDLERDGRLEAVTRGGQSLESRSHRISPSYEIPWHGCPC